MSKRAVLLILIGIIVIAAGLRFYGLDRQSLWYDEIVEESHFNIVINKLFFHTDRTPDVTPPLNSFFLYLMSSVFPLSDLALRMVPFTFGLISIPLLFIAARHLFNDKTGLIASFLLAVSPFHIWYSQDARMYALQWMLALVSIIFFMRALEHPTLKNFTGYVISTTAGLYTHQFALFLVAFQGLFLLLFFSKYKDQFLKWSISIGVSILLYLPWLVYSMTSLIKLASGGSIKAIDIKVLLYTIFTYSAGFSIGPSLRELHFEQSLVIIMPYVIEIGAIMMVYGSLFAFGLWSLRKDISRLAFLSLFMIVPIIGAFLLAKIKPEITYNVRYTGTALFAFLLFVAKGIDFFTSVKTKIPGQAIAVIAVVMVTGISAYSYSNYQFDEKYHKEDIRGAAAYVGNELEPGDLAVCIAHSDILNRYARRKLCHGIHFNRKYNKELLNEAMPEIIKGKKRFWLVLIREWAPHVKNMGNDIKDWFDVHYKEIKELRRGVDDIANIQVYCYDLTKEVPVSPAFETKRQTTF